LLPILARWRMVGHTPIEGGRIQLALPAVLPLVERPVKPIRRIAALTSSALNLIA
jgi:hypothetical protein